MSEDRPPYNGETPEETSYQIRDEATPRDYFAQIPNLVDLMELSPHAYRLYGHLRRVAGESGRCWQSTKPLAAACDMSLGKVSECKQELENVYPPLIRVESKAFDRGSYHEITITDIWELNHTFFTGGEITVKTAKGKAFHNMNGSRSQYEKDRSPCETKKNPVNNKTVNQHEKNSLSEKDLQDVNKQVDYQLAGILDPLRAREKVATDAFESAFGITRPLVILKRADVVYQFEYFIIFNNAF